MGVAQRRCTHLEAAVVVSGGRQVVVDDAQAVDGVSAGRNNLGLWKKYAVKEPILMQNVFYQSHSIQNYAKFSTKIDIM